MAILTVKLDYSRSTKHTFRFDAPRPEPGVPPSPISSLYVDQRAFDYKAPKFVTLRVEAPEAPAPEREEV